MSLTQVAEIARTRAATAGDAISEVVPRLIVEPETSSEVAAVLAHASERGIRLALRGGGTKIQSARVTGPVDAILSLKKLDQVCEHRSGDLTVTAQAGVTLSALNHILAREHQCLPLDSTSEEATLGGLIATNSSGPLRHRYGTPRDLLIGIHLATPEGLQVKSGGIVVKNVAGYDLGRLVSGSYGAFAAIVAATFKLTPLPAASSTIVADFRDADALVAAIATTRQTQLEPVAFDLHATFGGYADANHRMSRLLLKFASHPHAVDAQVAEIKRLFRAANAVFVLEEGAAATVWADHEASMWTSEQSVIRMSWHPGSPSEMFALFQKLSGADVLMELKGRAGIGAGLVTLSGPMASQLSIIDELQRSSALGNVVVMRSNERRYPRTRGEQAAGGLEESLKGQLDPKFVLRTAAPR